MTAPTNASPLMTSQTAGAVPITPFLCVSEAKKDDFDKGLAQCLVELYACGEINAAAGNEITVFGIVTNGASWQFYRREVGGEVFETSTFSIARPPDILGILDHVFAQCEQNLP